MKKYILTLSVFVLGCATRTVPVNQSAQNITANGKLFASLYQQRAAEYRALCYQAFNLARLRIDQALTATHEKPLAIVTDIDETVLDNSPYDVKQSMVGKDYEQKSWEDWTSRAAADTLAGAVSFLTYASSKGIKIFYLTNRAETERKGTLVNLVRFNFPDAVDANLILKAAVSSKEDRRRKIAETHEIVMLMGDNLADFSALFDKKPGDERLRNVTSLQEEFGKKFIVLPNPVYGDWETSLYQYNYNLTPARKDSIIKQTLKSY